MIIENMSEQTGNADTRLVRTISVFGLTKSATVGHLTEFQQLFPQFKLGFRTKFPQIQVMFYAGRPDIPKPKNALEDAVRWVHRKLGNYVFSDTGQPMEKVVGMYLHEKNATLAVAESCTGGLIANLLTDIPGSSDYFLFSAVTYANQAKMNILDVKAETLDRHGAVSEQTASEMARGAKNIVNATYGLATSGIAGPGGGTDDKPVGTVCIGLVTPFSAAAQRFNFTDLSRRKNKHIFAITALDMLRRNLIDFNQPHYENILREPES
jgi:nicotinamide-nucleotide amidase